MKKLVKFLLFLLFIIIIISCNGEAKEKYIYNIERIFYHEYARYTFLIRTNDIIIPVYCNGCPDNNFKMIIKDNVKDNESSWAYFKYRIGDGYLRMEYIELNIKSLNDITGADWNHGKFGKGKTIVVK